MKILTNQDFGSVARIVGLMAAIADDEPATWGQLKAAIEGLNWKDNVRVAAPSNLDLSTPGATIDGVTMAAGDRVLVKGNSTASQNGIYVWNGAAVAMTRTLDGNTADELENAIVGVDEGATFGGTTWRQTLVNFTLGSGSVAFTAFGVVSPPASESTAGIMEIATQGETDGGTDDQRGVTPLKLANWSGRLRRYAADLGDGSATSFTLTHNFNTRDVIVMVRRNSGNYDVVGCDIDVLGVNTTRVTFAVAPSAAQYRVIILA